MGDENPIRMKDPDNHSQYYYRLVYLCLGGPSEHFSKRQGIWTWNALKWRVQGSLRRNIPEGLRRNILQQRNESSHPLRRECGIAEKDITPIAVHNIYSFYESESSESESKDFSDINIDTLTLEQYLGLNCNNSQMGVKRPEIEKNAVFEIKSQLLKELRENTFSGGKTKDAMEHLRKILEIASLFNTLGISGNDIML
ncbi:hypothetical protein Tco_0386757 [Tanacetum coccineum]